MSHAPLAVPPPPERLRLPAAVQALSLVCLTIGAAVLAWAFTEGDHHVAWTAYLVGAMFTLGLGAFGAMWLAILSLTGATWSVTMRRIPEAMTSWLLPGSVVAMGVIFGVHSLYEWTHPESVAASELLTHKAPFLNMTMFIALVGTSLAVWVAFAGAFVRASRRQDVEGGMSATRATRVLSAIFLVVFALTLSIISFYFLMSLDAHWFSTMFAVLVFTDFVQTGTAFVAIVAGLMILSRTLNGFVNENHLHSLAKMVFASTGFWAYIYFCQYMLIWYANIPEETAYFIRRSSDGWLPYLLLLPLLKFVVPFVLLLPRDAKRNPRRLVPVAMLLLFAQFWELFLMVAPAAGEGAAARLPVIELAATLGFFGLFVLVFGWSLSRHEAVPLKDPALAACLAYES